MKAARDLDEGVARDLDEGVAVDVCLADASRADHALVAHHARVMTGAGAGLVVLADTVGAQLPYGCGEMFRWVRAETGSEVMLASHLHNDLGLGLANTLQALGAGVRMVSASWLGIAERAGMVATEQLLFLLAQHSGELRGEDAAPWWIPPDLTRLPVIAQMVAAETGVPLSVTTPIAGTGVGSLSTGTPFVHPRLFQPYDPQEVLGITPRVVLTHLASARVVTAVATRLGHTLGPVQTRGDGLGETARLPHRRGRGRGRRLRRIPRRPHPPGGWRHTVSPDAAAAREAAGMDDARRALREGTAVVLPNPAPLTHVVTAIRPHTVNEAKARPPGQPVALWAHHAETLHTTTTACTDLGPASVALAGRLLAEEHLTLLLPLRAGARVPAWLAPACKDGRVLLFGARWQPLVPLLDEHPVLYVSSANRTGRPPARPPPPLPKHCPCSPPPSPSCTCRTRTTTRRTGRPGGRRPPCPCTPTAV